METDVNEMIEKAARVTHEANRAWCIANGDMSQPKWEDAPEWQKASAKNGVAFHMANPDAGDSAFHDAWMAEKVAAGWVYGPSKNPDAQPPTHHCIVPFDELPKEQQVKDAIFRGIVHAILR